MTPTPLTVSTRVWGLPLLLVAALSLVLISFLQGILP